METHHLIEAVYRQDLYQVSLILENNLNNIDINTLDQYGYSALHYASKNGDTPMINLLLSNIPDIDINIRISYTRQTPLHLATLENDGNTMELLMNHKADPNITDNLGNTPLHNAIMENLPNAVELLLEHTSIFPNISNTLTIKNLYNKTPLELATDQKIKNILLYHTTKPPLQQTSPKKTKFQNKSNNVKHSYIEMSNLIVRLPDGNLILSKKLNYLKNKSQQQSFVNPSASSQQQQQHSTNSPNNHINTPYQPSNTPYNLSKNPIQNPLSTTV